MSDHKQSSEYVVGGWHLRKEVTISQIVTLASLLVAGIWWSATTDARIEQNAAYSAAEDRRIEQKNDLIVNAMNGRFDRYQQTVKEALGEIKGGIKDINDKMDRKADK